MILRAGAAAAGARRAPAADGHPQRDAGLVLGRARGGAARGARGARARADRRGRGHRSTSAGSPRAATGRRSSVDEEIARVCGLIAALAGEALISVDTYKPEVAEAAIAAGAAIVNDVSGLRDPRLAEVCARGGRGAGAHAHGGRAEGHAARPGHLRGRRGRGGGVPARADRGRVCGGDGRRSSSILDPGPDFAKTPAQTRRGAAPAGRVCGARAPDPARRLAQGLRRRDHRPRRRRERDPGTLAALADGVERAPRSCACTTSRARADYLAVRAVLRGERVLGALEGLSPERYPDGVPRISR